MCASSESIPKVLIVEDEVDAAGIYESALESTYRVAVVHDARTGLQQMEDTVVDLVMLDRRLPDISGDEFLSTIRDRGFTCPVIMLTAVKPDLDILWMDFDDYLLKPVTEAELLEAAERNLQLTAYQEPLQEYLTLHETQRLIADNNPEVDLRNHEKYQSVQERLDVLRNDVEEIVEELDDDQLIALGIRDLWLNN